MLHYLYVGTIMRITHYMATTRKKEIFYIFHCHFSLFGSYISGYNCEPCNTVEKVIWSGFSVKYWQFGIVM